MWRSRHHEEPAEGSIADDEPKCGVESEVGDVGSAPGPTGVPNHRAAQLAADLRIDDTREPEFRNEQTCYESCCSSNYRHDDSTPWDSHFVAGGPSPCPSNFEFEMRISLGGCFRKQGKWGRERRAEDGSGQATLWFHRLENRRERGGKR
jgi:hypothetical protein